MKLYQILELVEKTIPKGFIVVSIEKMRWEDTCNLAIPTYQFKISNIKYDYSVSFEMFVAENNIHKTIKETKIEVDRIFNKIKEDFNNAERILR